MVIKNQIKIRRKLLEVQKNYPLALAKLWVPHCHRWDGLGERSKRKKGCGKPMIRFLGNIWLCEKCDIKEKRTCQRDPFLNLGLEATAVFGGNRSGKSILGSMFCVASAASSSEWWVREWLNNNNLPHDIVPKKPSKVICSALSYADALSYVRPNITKYLPVNCTFRKWSAQDRASVILPNGGMITSYSAESGRKKYQGVSCSLAFLDEEHESEIFDELLMRIIDVKGKIFMSMTPLLGITWPNEYFIANPKSQNSFKYHSLCGLDNPYISSVKMRRAVNHLSEESQQSRLYGHFTNQTGLVYSEFQNNLHVIDGFEIPKEWKMYRAIDFGVVHDFACLVIAHNEKTNTLFVIDEYYKTEQTTIYNGNMVRSKFDKYGPFDFTVCDSASKDARLLIARHCGIMNKPAPKFIGVVNTINLVKGKLSPDADGKPHLFVFKNCKRLIKEFRLYSWSKKSTGKDQVIKKNDHGLDSLRYLIAFLYRYNRHL